MSCCFPLFSGGATYLGAKELWAGELHTFPAAKVERINDSTGNLFTKWKMEDVRIQEIGASSSWLLWLCRAQGSMNRKKNNSQITGFHIRFTQFHSISCISCPFIPFYVIANSLGIIPWFPDAPASHWRCEIAWAAANVRELCIDRCHKQWL